MKIYRSKIISFVVGMLLFINLQPYFTWSLISNNYIKLGLDFLTLVFLFLNMKKITTNDVPMIFWFFIILLMMAFFNGLNLFGIASVIVLVIIPFVSHKFIKDTYSNFKNIYAVFILCSLIVLLLLSIGVSLPHTIIPPLNMIKSYEYTAYPFLVIPGYGITSITQLGRFCGPFDEPGVVGTIGLIILFIEKFNLRKWQNIVIFISGMISFSLFFYLASFVFAAYYVFINKTKIIYRVLVIAGLSVFVVLSLDNEDISEYIWKRVEWDAEKSTISGDNRAFDNLEKYFDSIRGTKVYFWGLGLIDKNLMTSFDGSAGYRNAILRYGFVSSALYVIFFIIFAYKKIGREKEFLLFLLVFLLTLYQRPGLLIIHYIYLFVVFVYLNSTQEKILNIKNQLRRKVKSIE